MIHKICQRKVKSQKRGLNVYSIMNDHPGLNVVIPVSNLNPIRFFIKFFREKSV